jgi:hypothetical protein
VSETGHFRDNKWGLIMVGDGFVWLEEHQGRVRDAKRPASSQKNDVPMPDKS